MKTCILGALNCEVLLRKVTYEVHRVSTTPYTPDKHVNDTAAELISLNGFRYTIMLLCNYNDLPDYY